MTETFKTIEGFSKYLVSDNGNIKSIWFNKEIILKPRVGKNGYKYVIMTNDLGKKFSKYNHRLVALIFIDNPDNKKEVDHIDRDKLNNNVNNLRWANHSENNRNKNAQSNNKSGYSGISKFRNGWRVRITVDNIEKHIGVYKTIEEAIIIRKEHEKIYFKEYMAI